MTRQTGARNTRAPTHLLTGKRHGFTELASLWCGPCRGGVCWVREGMLVQGLQPQLFCVCFLPRKLPACERGRNTYSPDETL